MKSRYYSRGKLMITGEYLVLHGAMALAIPVRFGQSLVVQPTGTDGTISWKTFVREALWFEATFTTPGLEIADHNNAQAAGFVRNLLLASRSLNPAFLSDQTGTEVECHIDFDIRWGLGSSSSLISNVAWWAGVDPLSLHTLVSRGSGYDVACARSGGPLLFENQNGNRQVLPVDFRPTFAGQLYFIYLGKKKDSQADVDIFMRQKGDYSQAITEISEISRKMVICDSYDEFAQLMAAHEKIMTGVLDKPILKAGRFKGFPGEIKSLGAWGGDFAMALWPHGKKELADYLAALNLDVFFEFNKMIYYDSDEQK